MKMGYIGDAAPLPAPPAPVTPETRSISALAIGAVVLGLWLLSKRGSK
jgi:hypothetical protein